MCPRAYGSSSSLLGLKRWPACGSYGPCTRKPYTSLGFTSGMYPCQISSVYSGSTMRSSSRLPSRSNRHTSTLVACAENNVKFVPLPSQIAPWACELPSRTRLGVMTDTTGFAGHEIALLNQLVSERVAGDVGIAHHVHLFQDPAAIGADRLH